MARIADAEGYPYSRVEYMKDGSGRLKTQYRAGKDMVKDDTKNTRYAYAKPTAAELERLFGSNIGLAKFYKKNIAIDPNGVMNVSYIDNQGRTVATSIAGIPEGRANMDKLPFDSITLTENLMFSGAEQFYEQSGTLELTYPIFAASSSVYQFEYGFDIDPYIACSNVDVCFDCRYELVFQIVDENNDLVLEARDSVIEFEHLSCLSESYALDTISYEKPGITADLTGSVISVQLSAQKQYTIIKRLSLKQDMIVEDAIVYAENSSCGFLDLEHFQINELDNTDFTPCFSDYGDFDPCREIEERLKADFSYPYGRFVKDAPENAPITTFIYNELLKVSGCVEIDSLTLPQFTADFLAHFNLSQVPTFKEYEEEYIDYLIHFHPTYCQLPACKRYNNPSSLQFDRILEESDSIQEFITLAKGAGIMGGSDSIYFSYNPKVIVSNTLAANGDTLLIEYDSTLNSIMTSGVFEDFYNPFFIADSISYYEPKLLPNSRYCFNPQGTSNITRAYTSSYFTSFRGCNASQVGIAGITDLFPEGDIQRWQVYKKLYLQAKGLLIKDLLNGLVCFQSDITANCVVGGDYHYPWIDSVGYRNYEHFVGTNNSISFWLDTIDLEAYTYSTKAMAESTEPIANQLYALLLSDSCISPLDSAAFVSSIDTSILFCSPFEYLDTLGGFLFCDPLMTNISTVLAPFRKHYADSSGNPIFSCNPTYQERYNCEDFHTAHQVYLSAYGSQEIPVISNLGDISIFDTLQKRYKNWMNYRFGLNLSFNDYNDFAIACTQDESNTVFGQTVYKDELDKVEEIRRAVIEMDNFYHKGLSESQLFNEINSRGLSGTTNELDPLNDYLGFGEADLDNSQCDLFYFESGKTILYNLLDTADGVYSTIKSNLQTHQNFEESYEANCVPVNLSQYTAVSGFSNLLIDRVYRYSSGTVWVRLLNASDSSFYNDYYYHYEPYNRIYKLNEVSRFGDISPVFDKEELHYARLITASLGAEMLFSTSKPIAQANRIEQIELSAYKSMGSFPLDQTCEDLKYERAKINALVKYDAYIEALKDTFKMKYRNFCLNDAISNQYLDMTHVYGERQFTLYYYDNAGNLVMTVPPGGVDVNFNYTSDTAIKIANYRLNDSATLADQVLPAHTKRTTYKYNSNNDVIRQVTPNSDTTYFWYDKAGRLVFSQNAEQQMSNDFSYTLYDAQSRIVEVGEVTLNEFSDLSWGAIHAVVVLEIMDSATIDLDSVILSKQRNDVVKSFYDTKILHEPSYGFSQNNLRSRLATQAYYTLLDNNSTVALRNWEFATHYSYDPTGNVKTLVNDFYQEETMNRNFDRFKRIDYAYDVVSGNVLQVYYQLGHKDAFYHRYEYDAENRITQVETSRDGIIWDEDANYEYYLHGPLARTELGEHRVQGIDYAYTLQGWVKAVNAGHKNADMGMDHEKDNVFAADAFGFALQYYKDDYKSIGSLNDILIASSEHSDLYNGNIAAISLHNQELTYGREYIYDQINRLKAMSEHDIDEESLSWGALSDSANMSNYEYDKNGNLTALNRRDGIRDSLMDGMSYHYINGKDQLSYVDDVVPAAAFANDIDQQVSGNYNYDKIGNLVTDSAEGICKIRWYPNGKVKRIIRFNPTRQKADLAFEYDGMGNRVKKTVSFIEDGKSYFRTVYYVRDAQGNILTTYEERNCELFAGDDTLGDYYYQFTESYAYYTQEAINQLDVASVMNFLTNDFSKRVSLKVEASNNLDMIPNIRDSIMEYLVLSQYLDLYPAAINRIFNYDRDYYAEAFFTNDKPDFISVVNYKREAYIQHLIINNGIQSFYSDYNNRFTSKYSLSEQGENAHYFNSIYKTILQELFDLGNATMIKDLLGLSSGEYNTIFQGYSDPGYAYRELVQLMELLDRDLLAKDPTKIQYYTRMIRALLLSSDIGSSQFEDIMNSVNLTNFYNAYSGWLTGGDLEALNSLLYLLHGAHDSFGLSSPINVNSLKPFNPLSYTLDFVNYDTNGDYLKYFIHLDYTYEEIFNPVESFLSGLILTGSNLYFNGSSTYQFVIDAILAQITHPSFVSVMENDPFSMIVLEDLNEDISLLIHYFNTYHLDQTVWQHYYYDTLSTTLSGVNHLSPYSYAKEMEEELGVNFPDLSGCPPDSLYMLASTYNLYGSSRLGVMDAQKPRQDGEHTFSRKLGAKQYELTDHLGNVMATISDKKLHPQELVPLGSQNIDTSIGFQPEVTGRYDYYPFGMEIMSRSGNFTNIDYTTDVTELLYSGLLKDCDNYDLITTSNISKHCITTENLYGQEYVDTIRIDRPVATYFNFTVDLPLDEVIGEIDPEGNYSIQFTFTSEGRWVYDWPGITGIESIDDNPDATLNEIRAAKVKYLTFHYTGTELNNLATNGILEYRLQGSNGQSGTWDPFVKINNIRVTQTFENTTVPLAMRDESPFERGFQGMQRQDSWSGSGNHYTTFHRPYDPRTGRWDKTDPLKADFPWQSPYVGMDNNPIWNTDIRGDSTSYFNSSGELIYQSNDGLENAVVSISDKQLGNFNNTLTFAKQQEGFDGNSNEFNKGLRKLGTGYAVDDFKAFFKENGKNQADGWEEGYYNEHKTFLYMKDGLIRPGSENYPGDVYNAGGDPTGNLPLGDLHFHPNAGKQKGFGSNNYFTHRPSGPDGGKPSSWKYSSSPNHFDVIVTDKYIYFINNVRSRNVVVPFKNTFGGGNSVESWNPKGE